MNHAYNYELVEYFFELYINNRATVGQHETGNKVNLLA